MTQSQLPRALNKYGCSDYAVTDDGGDYTVMAIFGLHEDDIWLLDGWYGKTTSDVWIEHQIDLIKKHSPLAFFGEGGVIQKAVEPMLKRRMLERQAHCRLEWLPSISDKPTRARSFQARASMGRVHLPDDELGHWFLDQLLKFPAGKHDDAVDVCSLMGRAVDQAHPAIFKAPKKVKPRPNDFGKHRKPVKDGSWKAM